MATGHMYAKAPTSLLAKLVNYSSDAIKIALFTSSISISQNSDQYYDAAPYTSNEASGTGYTAGGQALTSVTVSNSTTKCIASAANPSWTSASFSCAYAVIYDNTPATNKPLLAYIDLGGTQTVANGTFQITVDATNGLFYFQVS